MYRNWSLAHIWWWWLQTLILNALLNPLAKNPPKGAMIDANKPRHNACHWTGRTSISFQGNCKSIVTSWQSVCKISSKQCNITLKLTHPGIHAGKVKGSGLNNGSASHCSQPVDKSCRMIHRFTISSLKDRVQDQHH